MNKILFVFVFAFYYEIVKAKGIFDYEENFKNQASAENLIDEVVV